MIIGITGKSGSGKSTYAKSLSENNGFFVINVDNISHQVMDMPQIKAELIKLFGDSVINNNEIDIKYIGDLIFENRHIYKQMSDLVWTEMKSIIDNLINEHKDVIIDWILLPHTHYWKMCEYKILMIADEEERKQRVMIRDNITEEYLRKRDSASIDYSGYTFDSKITT